MKPKIPKSIRERVIKQWLQAVSRDQIAKENEIGAGTVTAIIKDADANSFTCIINLNIFS